MLLLKCTGVVFHANFNCIENSDIFRKLLFYLVRPERFELPTNRFEADYSIQLSYGRIEGLHYG